MALGSNGLSLACLRRKYFRKSLRPCGYVPKGVASKDVGVGLAQGVKSVGTQPSSENARHGNTNEHGTAQDRSLRMDEHLSDISRPLRPQWRRSYAPLSPGTDYTGVSEAAGFSPRRESHEKDISRRKLL